MVKRPTQTQADAIAEFRAMLERLQDPDYVLQVIKRCQERGMIPATQKDADPSDKV